jgi:hypothetical protein
MKKKKYEGKSPQRAKLYGSGRKDDILTHLSKILPHGSAWSGKICFVTIAGNHFWLFLAGTERRRVSGPWATMSRRLQKNKYGIAFFSMPMLGLHIQGGRRHLYTYI